MDDSGSRLVHGGGERFPNFDAVPFRNWNWRSDFPRSQSARVHHLSGDLSGNRGTNHECVEILRRPSPTKTRAECSDGRVTKSHAKVSYALQKTSYSIFRFLRSHPLGTIISVWTH